MKKKWAGLAVASSVLAAAAMTVGVSGTALAGSHPALTVFAQNVPSWQQNFNPFNVNNLQEPNGTIYESLFYFSSTGQTYNMLGTKYAWSNGNKTLTVTLRNGVKWNDGKSLTASDVAFTYGLMKKFPALDTHTVWQDLTSVKAINASTIQYKFSRVDVPFAQQLLGQVPIVPQHIWSSVSDPAKWTDATPVGTGPYMLGKFASQQYTLKANPHYWGGTPAAAELDYPAYSSNDSSQLQLVKGSLDWADLFMPNINKLYVNKDKANNHYWFGQNGDVDIYPNLKNPLLADPTVREAISLAVNRQQLDNIGEYGYEPAANPTGLILSSEKAWIAPGVATSFAFDVTKANSILDKAGYVTGSDGVRAKNGNKLEFTLIAPSGWTDWNEDQALVAQQLKAVGIQINVQAPQQSDWQNQLDKHTFQLALESSYVESGTTPFYGYYNYLTANGGFDYESYNNPVVTKALNSFRNNSNINIQKQAMYTIEKQIATDLPVIPLVEAASWYEFNTKNYTGWPDASHQYVDAPPYNPFSTGIVLMHLKLK